MRPATTDSRFILQGMADPLFQEPFQVSAHMAALLRSYRDPRLVEITGPCEPRRQHRRAR